MQAKLAILAGLATVFVSLGASRAHADTIEPGHFIVNLNDDCSTDPSNPDCSNMDGTGGWTPDSTITDQINPGISTRGFTASMCVDPDNDNDCDRSDPSIRINPGGGSSPFPGSFTVDDSGGGIFDFQNDTGSPFTELLFITNYISDGTYTCTGTSFFTFCGFKIITNQQGQKEIEILFANGSIPTASTPEPAEYFFLLGACAAVLVLRRRSSA